jgi:hypothetical protein
MVGVGEGAAAGALENDALGILRLRRVLVHHANQLCCLHVSQHQAYVVEEQPKVAVLVECSVLDAMAGLGNNPVQGFRT